MHTQRDAARSDPASYQQRPVHKPGREASWKGWTRAQAHSSSVPARSEKKLSVLDGRTSR